MKIILEEKRFNRNKPKVDATRPWASPRLTDLQIRRQLTQVLEREALYTKGASS